MADNVSRETRSKMMRSIRSVSRLEDRISKQLWRLGLRFRRNARTLPGKPDIAIKKYKIAIFIDSCFWHSCPEHRVMPKSNVEFWEKKFEANKRRDEKVNGYYLSNGWHLLRNWEHDFKSDFDATVRKIHDFIIDCKAKSRQ